MTDVNAAALQWCCEDINNVDSGHAGFIAGAEWQRQQPRTAAGVQIGANDSKGRPIHVGDTLLFDEKEWGEPMQFTIELIDGSIQHPGATDDLTEWCEIIRAWDEA